MTGSFRHLEFKSKIKSPADEVYRAFIHPTALKDWLCNAAQVEPRPGGRLYFAWEEGYYVNGAFTGLEPGKSLAFTWHGKDEPAATRVTVTLTPEGEQTQLVLCHDDIPTGPEWDTTTAELKKGWESALENLQSMLETGIDLREARRPLMGIFIVEFTPEIAAQLGVPVKEGVRLQGTAEGSGARAAGLQDGDVLVRLAGQELTGYASLGPVIRKYKAGDEVEVAFYRKAELKTAPLKFSARVFPRLASRAAALAKAVKKDFRTLNVALAKRLKDCPEAALEKRPAEGEWNVKETLAHLILCERDQQTWIASMLNDREIPESLDYSPNVLPRVQALVAVYPSRQQILTEFKRNQKESLALLSCLPDKFVARKHIYNRLARWYLEAPQHHREHLAQMDALLAIK